MSARSSRDASTPSYFACMSRYAVFASRTAALTSRSTVLIVCNCASCCLNSSRRRSCFTSAMLFSCGYSKRSPAKYPRPPLEYC